MRVSVKYIILVIAVIAAIGVVTGPGRTAAGLVAAGGFIAYAIIEKQDLQILNEKEE